MKANINTFKPKAYIATDSYKLGHMSMYPVGSETVYSNFTPRSTKHSPIPLKYSDGKIVVYGNQAVIIEMIALWNETFFSHSWDSIKDDLERITAPFVGDNGFTLGVSNFKRLHDIGYLPLTIKSLTEGSVIPAKIPMFTIQNTEGFFWLTNYIETYLSQNAWKMPTVATIARAYRRIIEEYADATGADDSLLDIQGHDFSARGLSGSYDNASTGSAHLTSFKGTDSLLAVQFTEHFYDGFNTFVGCSVPATEHSVMTAGGGVDEEIETFRTLLSTYNKGIVSIVSDSYDFWDVIIRYTVELKEQILAREYDSFGLSKVVFRPDTGDPADIICGTAIPVSDWSLVKNESMYKFIKTGSSKTMPPQQSFIITHEFRYYEVVFKLNRDCTGYNFIDTFWIEPKNVTPEMKGSVECLWDVFGGTNTSKGYRQLSDRVGLIYGDSITMKRADDILNRLKNKGYSSTNVVLGVGSYSYQFLTRDTFGFAMKSTAITVDGEMRNIFKDPKTDDGTKKSACGLMRVDKVDGEFVLTDKCTPEQEAGGELKVIYKDNEFYNLIDFETIRSNLKG